MNNLNWQESVSNWLTACFGTNIKLNKPERNYRFIEESLELVQSAGMNKEEVLKMVDYVYSRPIGEMNQEVGGVMITLTALCLANDISLDSAMYSELQRVWVNIDKIKEKQKSKPHRGRYTELE